MAAHLTVTFTDGSTKSYPARKLAAWTPEAALAFVASRPYVRVPKLVHMGDVLVGENGQPVAKAAKAPKAAKSAAKAPAKSAPKAAKAAPAEPAVRTYATHTACMAARSAGARAYQGAYDARIAAGKTHLPAAIGASQATKTLVRVRKLAA
jgi:hypothetical protein